MRAVLKALASFVLMASLYVGGAAHSTACTKQQEQQVASDLSDVAACVINRAESGEEPLVVVGECAATGIEAVVKIVETFLAKRQANDSGALKLVHDQLQVFLDKAKALQAVHP